MNNLTNDLKRELTYEEMKKGLDPEFVYGQGTTLFKHFLTSNGQPMEQGTIQIVGNYKALPDAKKVYLKLKKHLYNRKLSKTHSIMIRNILRNNNISFALAVLRLTDEDMEVKSKFGKKNQIK
jgi:hypothetical protein